MKHKVFIVEDEVFAREELKRLLNKVFENHEVVGEAESVEDAVEFLKNSNVVDLIFLDIQLSDGLSFEIFNQIQVDAPIIFTTAFNQFALKAFEQNSVDYLLKPIEEESLTKSISKYLKQTNKSNDSVNLNSDQVNALLGLTKPKPKSRFIAKVGDQIKMISSSEIAFFYADDNLVFLVKKDSKRNIIDYKLEELELRLNTDEFYRINRTFIISFDCIKEVHKYFNGRLKLEVNTTFDKEFLVARNRVSGFLKWLDQ